MKLCIVLVSVIAFILKHSAVATEAASSDPCAIYDPSKVFNSWQYVPLTRLRQCVESIPDNNPGATVRGLKSLKTYLSQLYAFGDLVQDSSTTDDNEVPFPQWKPYKLSVDFNEELDGLITKASTNNTSAYSVQAKVTQLYNSLQDAHTRYLPSLPFYVQRPVFFSIHWEENGCKEHYRLHSLIDMAPSCAQCKQQITAYKEAFQGPKELYEPEVIAQKEVVKVNGLPVKQYVNEMAQRVGLYKDEGVRLNHLLRDAALGEHLEPIAIYFPEEDFEVYEFADGTSLKIQIAGVYRVDQGDVKVDSTAALEGILGGINPLAKQFWEIFELEDADGQPGSTGRRLLDHLEIMERQLEEEKERSKAYQRRHLSELEEGRVETVAYVESTSDGRFANLLKAGETPVFYLSTFMWDDSSKNNCQSSGEMMNCVLELLYKAIEMAKATSSKRLIVDMAGNTGGNIIYGNALVYALNKNLNTMEKLQDPVDIRLSEFWQSWLKLYGSLSEQDATAPLSETVLREFQDDWESLLDLCDLVWQGHQDSMSTLISRLRELLPPAAVAKMSLEELQAAFLKVRKDLWAYYTNEGEESGWGPFSTGLTRYTADGKRIEDIAKYVLENAEEHMRGGVKGMYTPKMLMGGLEELFSSEGATGEAGPSWLSLLKEAPSTSDIEVIILSDGLCGSTCSLFMTKLLATDSAQIVTYGGSSSSPLDSSSFSGGMIFSQDNFLREVLTAYAAGYLVSGGKTMEKELTRAIMPMFHKSTTSFTFLEVYIGKSPHSLPYEWYQKPGHFHLPLWRPLAGPYTIYEIVGTGKYQGLAQRRYKACGGETTVWSGIKGQQSEHVEDRTAARGENGKLRKSNLYQHYTNSRTSQDSSPSSPGSSAGLKGTDKVWAVLLGLTVGMAIVGFAFASYSFLRKRQG